MRIHIVQEGENLNNISGLYQVSVESLKKYNHIVDERLILPGLKLRVREDKMKIEDFWEDSNSFGKHYRCPHCKNIVLIPD